MDMPASGNWNHRARTRLRRFVHTLGLLGVQGTLANLIHARPALGFASPSVIRPCGVPYPLSIRPGSSDMDVIRQVFVEREYACLDDLPQVGLVIDCGAYGGFSSSYFLSSFTSCQVIAVEPDPANFALLQRNLAPYGSRAKAVRAAVWDAPAKLALSSGFYRDGREWSRQVRRCAPGEQPQFEGIDVGTLLRESGHERISLLKVDVEGAETLIFNGEADPWLDRVDAIAIELHDDSAFGDGSAAFHSAIRRHRFKTSRSGELTICRR